MSVKRVFYVALSLLLVGLIVYFIVMEIVSQRQEQAYQKGWTIYQLNQGAAIDCKGIDISAPDIATDQQGRIYVTGGCNFDGIHVFDGAQWLTYTFKYPKGFGDISINSQGEISAIDWRGSSVAVFDGEKWSVNDNANDFEQSRKRVVKRVGTWQWFDQKIVWHPDSGGSPTILTPQNSGLGEEKIMGLVVDNYERLWVLDGQGVRMIPIKNLNQIQENINLMDEALKIRDAIMGYIWLPLSVLGIVLLAKYLNAFPGILLALVIGVTIMILFGGSTTIADYIGRRILHPGFVACCGGIIGGLLGGLKDRESSTQDKSTRWNIIGAIIGFIVGLVLGLGWFMLNWIASVP